MTPDILGKIVGRQDVDPMDRLVDSLSELAFAVSVLRQLGMKIGLTSGSFDLPHIGHTRYIRRGGAEVDIMIVGVETDDKTRQRKGPHRPVVPFEERVEMIASTRWADILVTKRDSDPQWGLIKTVRPDVLLTVRETYGEKDTRQLRKFCGRLLVVDRQAETSTSAKIRRVQLGGADELIRLGQGSCENMSDLVDKLLGEGNISLCNGLDRTELIRVLVEAHKQDLEKVYRELTGGGV